MGKYNYQIIVTSHDKQLDFIKSFRTEAQVNKYFNSMLNENKNIKFPVKYISRKKIEEAKYELVIIKRKNEDESSITKLRNNYGEFTEYNTNNDDWIVYDKAPYDIEESFWIYGYHPLVDRKSFSFIIDELVKPKVTNKYEFAQIIIFLNKLIIKSYNKTDMVICKNKSDCIRLYNEIKKCCEKNKKYKYCLFSGDWNSSRKLRKDAIEIISKLTNWNKLKITRNSTRP